MCLCLALPLFLFAPFLAVEALAGVRVVRVAAPSGVDDTAAIQAALDACVAAGPGCVVQFGPGIYKTRQVFAIGFHGAIQGRGAKLTTIEALPGLTVTQAERFWDNPPSAAEPYPALISFWNSDVAACHRLGRQSTNRANSSNRLAITARASNWASRASRAGYRERRMSSMPLLYQQADARASRPPVLNSPPFSYSAEPSWPNAN